MTPFARAACAAGTLILATAGPAVAQDEMPLDDMTVLLDWFVNPDHAALVVAQEAGMFEAQGLEVELIEPADPNDPPKLVAAGGADLAVSYQPQLHLLVDAGLPLVRVGTLVATPLNTLVVLADSDIQSIADLEGKRVGYSVGGLEDALLGAMLAEHGLGLDDITLINVNFSLSPSLMAGETDAVIGAFRNFELNQMDIMGEPGRAFYVEEEGVPPYDELIVVTRPELVVDDRIVRFMDAVEAATQYLINHPDAAWEMFIAAYPDLEDELNRRAWADTLPRLALRPAALDERRYQRFAAFLQDLALIGAPPEIGTYAVAP